MKHLIPSIALAFGILAGASAQVTPNGAHSDVINMKIHEVDMLLQIMPLLLTKDQINHKIVPAIEKARDQFKKELAFEDDELAKIEPLADEAIKNAYEKGAYPPRTITGEIAGKESKLEIQRKVFMGVLIQNMQEVLDATLDSGQKKVILGSFDTGFIDPTAKPGSVTDDKKMRFFIQRIFLDPTSYEILKKLGNK